jgi:holo-[acyl-carrier protein] synthase
MNLDKIHAIGIDAIEVKRIEKVFVKFGNRFLNKVFTENEIQLCRGRVQEIAGRFSAKEAAMKALGTGVIGINWKEIEILVNKRGKPTIQFFGKAQKRAQFMQLEAVDISITHLEHIAISIVVGISKKEN